MNLKVTVLLWMLLVSGLAAAQNSSASSFQLKGVLLDSLTQEGEPYATIRVARKSAPDKPVKMMVSDMKGRFQENVKGTGQFVMTVTSVGRNTIVKNFTVKSGQKLVDTFAEPALARHLKTFVDGAAILNAHTILSKFGLGFLSDWSKGTFGGNKTVRNDFYIRFGRAAHPSITDKMTGIDANAKLSDIEKFI